MPKSARSSFARRALASAIISAVAVGVMATPAMASTPSQYVSLGDSFVAGPLIPNQTTDPLGCLRSDSNYPSLVAEAAAVDEFVDASCSGATTEDMFAPQETTLGTNAPQLDSLTESTTLVTLGVGGNDMGFADILINCVTSGLTAPKGSPCQEEYTYEGGDELRDRIAQTVPKVEGVMTAIAERAPEAEIIVVGYPAILPEEKGCWPKVTIGEGDVPYLDGVQQDLNAALADTAQRMGGSYVDVYERGHDVCSARSDRWVEGIVPTRPAAPVHPNAPGMEALAGFTLEHIGIDAQPTPAA